MWEHFLNSFADSNVHSFHYKCPCSHCVTTSMTPLYRDLTWLDHIFYYLCVCIVCICWSLWQHLPVGLQYLFCTVKYNILWTIGSTQSYKPLSSLFGLNFTYQYCPNVIWENCSWFSGDVTGYISWTMPTPLSSLLWTIIVVHDKSQHKQFPRSWTISWHHSTGRSRDDITNIKKQVQRQGHSREWRSRVVCLSFLQEESSTLYIYCYII